MRIERLEIENFRRFREVRLDVPDGVIGLVGRNGAGKSTLIEAIGWVIFGRFASRTGRMEDVKRRGAAHAEDARVRLVFHFDGHAYDVVRELKGKNLNHTASLRADGEVVVQSGANSGDHVTRYLERLFHMDREAFFTSLVARQKDLDGFSELTPAERKEQIIRLLRIDAVDEAIERARRARREARARAEALSRTLKDERALAEGLETVVKQRAALETRRASAADAVARASGEMDARRAERDAWQARARDHQDLAERLARERERFAAREREAADLAATLARLDALDAEARALAPRVAELTEARAELTRLTLLRERRADHERRRAELARTLETVNALAQDLARVEETIAARLPARRMGERLRVELEDARGALATLERETAGLAAESARAKRDRDAVLARKTQVARLGRESPCPTCTRPLHDHYEALLGEFDREAAEHAAREAELAKSRAALDAQAGALREKVAALRERELEVARKLEDLTRLEGERGQLHPRLAGEQKRAADLAAALDGVAPDDFSEGTYAAARARVQDLEKASAQHARLVGELSRRDEVVKRAALVKEEVALVAEALRSVEARLKALAFDRGAFQSALNAAERALAAHAEAREALARLEGDAKRFEEEEARLARDLAENAERAREVAALREDVLYLERVAGDRDQGLLPEFKDHLVSRIRPTLAEEAGRLFRDLTDGKYAGLEIGEDYDIQVLDGGEAFSLDRFSGGEADLANLCLRLAIGQLIADRAGGTEFGFIAFDEIFGSQDEVRKQNILRALARLQGKFRQILVVTHVEDVKESVERVIRVDEDADGVSTCVLE